jgi:hypothetical protein
LSRRDSSSEAKRSSALRSGRLAPLGGIMPVRIFLTTFSHVSDAGPTRETSRYRGRARRSSRAGCGSQCSTD